MPNPRDEEFIRFAAASGHLTPEQAQEALAALRDIEALGGVATAPDLLLKRGLLNERQAALVHQAMAASKAATKVPRELGGFELLEKIGQGGMGSVFKARQKELGRIVALKILSPRLARSNEFVQSFLREARAAGRLNHPNIVAAIDVGESQGFYYFAMEFVDGETVAKMLARGPLPEERALGIAADVARALDHAYAKGLIHRDIKPDNIMVTSDGRVRVTDFGLAKAIGKGTPEGTDDERFMGTPAYVAPEQIRSEPDIDCRADIFSLGVTLFQMLTGELPFQGANPMAIAAAVVAEPLPPLRRLAPDVSPAAARLVEKMTAKDPVQRYATPADVVAAIESAAEAPRAPAARVAQVRALAARRRRSNAPTVAAVGIILAVAAVAVLAITLRPRQGGTRSGTHHDVGTTLVPSPRTSVRVPAPDTSRRVTADVLMRDLSRAVDRANAFEKDNPRDAAGLAARLRSVLDDFPAARRSQLPPEGLDLLRQTELRLRGIEDRAATAVETELQERTARADALLKEGKINEAFALLDTFPTALRTSAAIARIEQLRLQWRKDALAAYDARDGQGKKLVADVRLDEAKALYGPYAECVVPEIAAKAKAALAAVEADYEKKMAEAKRKARALYVKEAKAIFAHLDARELREARNLADAAVVNNDLDPVREETRDLLHLVRTATEVWDMAKAGARKLKPGDRLRIAGFAGEVVEVTDDKIAMKIGTHALAKRITDLAPADAIELAIRGYGASAAAVEAKLGLFLLATRERGRERDFDGARKRIQAARANGADVARELALLARFSPQECPTCKGQTTVPCPDCGGKGIASIERQECDVCKGKGGGPCGYCHAKGRVRCANCNGTGKVLGGALPCNQCGGDGVARCGRCGGTGYLKCSKCKATGIFTIVTPCARCRERKTVTCPQCEGKGSLPPPDLAEPEAPRAPKP